MEGRGQCSGCRPGLTLKKKNHLLVILEHSKNVGGVSKNSKGHHFEYTGSHIETDILFVISSCGVQAVTKQKVFFDSDRNFTHFLFFGVKEKPVSRASYALSYAHHAYQYGLQIRI